MFKNRSHHLFIHHDGEVQVANSMKYRHISKSTINWTKKIESEIKEQDRKQ